MTDLTTEHAVDFIEATAGSPFFLSVQYNAPNWPYQPPDSPSIAENNADHLQPDDENPGSREDYIAMVERVDQGIGEILAAVEAAGIDDNTFIIFTNDNGGEWLSRNDPLFHRKSSVYEGGIRTPALMRWPGVIPEGMATNQVGITMDLTRTILAAAGASEPHDLEFDGINLLPIVTGDAPVTERTLFWRTRGEARAVRSGDWKLIVEFAGFGEVNMIFNLQRDIGERNDIARTEQGKAVARQLRPLLDAWEAEMTAEGSVWPWIAAD
jgi:arylsulfatase A-like enzyme